jgi:hypothetical protein
MGIESAECLDDGVAGNVESANLTQPRAWPRQRARFGLPESGVFVSHLGIPEDADTRLLCVPEQAGFSPMDGGYEVSAALSSSTDIRRIC